MNIDGINTGTYIAAISGGVDSMVLLDLLNKKTVKEGLTIIVAHVDHGIRKESHIDRKLVELTAKKYGFQFESIELNLGTSSSENLARQKRYKYLNELKDKYEAVSIITAHHEDDLIETAILNLIRGTGRKGLSSIKDNKNISRPLLTFSKAEIVDYAKTNDISWHEDSTNQDNKYLRNYVRHNIVPKFDQSARLQFINIINSISKLNQEIDYMLNDIITDNQVEGELDGLWFANLSHSLSKEVMASWLRENGIRDFDKKTIERLVVSAKVGKNKQKFPVIKEYNLELKNNRLALITREC